MISSSSYPLFFIICHGQLYGFSKKIRFLSVSHCEALQTTAVRSTWRVLNPRAIMSCRSIWHARLAPSDPALLACVQVAAWLDHMVAVDRISKSSGDFTSLQTTINRRAFFYSMYYLKIFYSLDGLDHCCRYSRHTIRNQASLFTYIHSTMEPFIRCASNKWVSKWILTH